jgi:hypothetical protein
MMTTLKIRDLIGRSVPFFIRFPNAVVPTQTYEGKHVSNGITLPDPRVTVDSIRDYGNGTVFVTGTHLGGSKYGVYLAINFDGMSELPDTDLAEVKAKFAEIQLDSLHRNLNHSWYSGTDHTFFLEDNKGNIIPGVSLYDSVKLQDNLAYARGMGVHIAASPRTCLQEHHNLCASSFFGIVREYARSKHPTARISMRTVADLPSGVVPANVIYKRAARTSAEIKNVYGLIPQNKDDSFQIAESHYSFGLTVSEQKAASIIKTLDATIGLACLSMFGKYEDPRRRLVSLPGDYATKKDVNGYLRLEYRALSNMWMCSPFTYYLVADVMRKAIALANNNFAAYWKATEHEVIDVLVSCDQERARKILERNRKVLTKMVAAAYPWVAKNRDNSEISDKDLVTKRTDTLVNLFFQDVDAFVAHPTHFEKNWTLDGRRGDWAPGYGKMVFTYHAGLMNNQKV